MKDVVEKKYFVGRGFKSHLVRLAKANGLVAQWVEQRLYRFVFFLLCYSFNFFFSDAVKQGYFVIQLARNSCPWQERTGSNPVMCPVCQLLIQFFLRCRSTAILRLEYPIKSGRSQVQLLLLQQLLHYSSGI